LGKVKGQFLVLGFSILGLTLIGLGILILSISKESTSQVIIVGSLERLNNLDSSIKKSLNEIFNKNSGISISGNNSEVIFNENISNNMLNYNLSMYNFKKITESNFKNVELNTTNLSAELHLIVHPNLIDYSHDFNNKKIKILPQALNVNGYFFNITIPASGDLICNGARENGSFSFRIQASTTNNKCDNVYSLNPTKTSSIDVTSDINIKLQNPAFATITSTNSNVINVKTAIILNTTINSGSIKVKYPDNIYKIDFLKEIGIYKRDTATLYTRLMNSSSISHQCDGEC